MYSTVILHNIIAPYKTLLFNELYDIYQDFKVVYISKTEQRRDWDVIEHEIEFPYTVMFDLPSDDVSAAQLFKTTWSQLENMNPRLVIIDGYSYSSCWAGLIWAKLKKRRTILWSSSNTDDHERVFYKEGIKKIFVRNCDAYNVYGKKSKEYLQKLGVESFKIRQTGNATDNDYYLRETARWREKREELCQRYGFSRNNFLYIGRFSEEKNIFYLLEAFRMACDSINDWGLILVGSGPLEKKVASYLQKYSIKNVYMPGYVQKDNLPKYMAMSDVFVLPSLSEPWGLVVNEAMAAGMPVLVSRKCGCAADLVVEGENGFSFDPLDKNSLIMLIRDIAEGKMDLQKMGNNSLDIISGYTPHNAAKIVRDTVWTLMKNELYMY